MERNLSSAVAIAKLAALLAFSVLCITAAVSVANVDKHISATLMHLNDELDEMHRLTLEAGLTAMEARKASAKEIKYLDAWNEQISASMTNFSQVMLEMNKTLVVIQGTGEAATGAIQTTQVTIAGLQAPISQATATLQAAQQATEALQPVIAHVDALVSDPHLAGAIAHTDSTAGHLDATAADVQQEIYKYTHPGIWAKVKGALLDIAHVFNPL